MPDDNFETRLQRLLRDDAEQGVRPIDAVAVARTAAARRRAGRLPWASLLRGTRYVLVAALFAIGLAAFAVGSGLVVVPGPTASPSATPTAVAQSPIAGSPSPGATESASPTATASSSPVPTITSITPLPTATAAPDVTPTEVASPSPTASPEPTPTPSPASAWSAVAGGSGHACAIRDGTVFCWGENEMGELGDGTTSNRWAPDVPVVGLGRAVDVAAGIRFSCAVVDDGSVWCWGENLGDDGTSSVPQAVPGIDDAVAIAAGGAHACALRAGGEIACWGLGQLGQLGNGTIIDNNGNADPVAVSDIDNAVAITAGWNHTCALRADRTVWCWGGNGDGATGYGQIGDGTLDNAPSPVQVVGLDEVVAVAAGGWSTCAVRADRSAWCWGYGERGGLGDGLSGNSATPVQASGLDDAVGITVGGWHACALRSAGNVMCWGDNSFAGGGGLGDGTRTDRATPVDAIGMSNAVMLSGSQYGTLAIRADGTLWGWGWYVDSVPGPLPGAQ